MSATPSAPRVDAPSALPPGTRLGEFELREVLGVGGFGIVYLAFDHALEREVAVKEYMPAALAGRTQALHVSVRSQSDAESFVLGLKSFVNEARLLARFDHPSLLKVHRFWEDNGTAYMAMPVMRGRTVKDVRQAMGQPPDEAWLRALLEPLLGAIEKLHSEGVYHRDIAPDNIQIEPDGHPVLLDFGAARRVLSDKSQTLTAILKPAYAPIEQYAEAGAVRQGPWTDLYALGATLHYVLLQRPPAPATTRAVHDEPSKLTTQRLPGCSAEFLRIIDWMLQPRPADRPQSVAALRAVLEGRDKLPAAPTAMPPPAQDSAWDETVVMRSGLPGWPGAPSASTAPSTAPDADATRVVTATGALTGTGPPSWPGAAVSPPLGPRASPALDLALPAMLHDAGAAAASQHAQPRASTQAAVAQATRPQTFAALPPATPAADTASTRRAPRLTLWVGLAAGALAIAAAVLWPRTPTPSVAAPAGGPAAGAAVSPAPTAQASPGTDPSTPAPPAATPPPATPTTVSALPAAAPAVGTPATLPNTSSGPTAIGNTAGSVAGNPNDATAGPRAQADPSRPAAAPRTPPAAVPTAAPPRPSQTAAPRAPAASPPPATGYGSASPAPVVTPGAPPAANAAAPSLDAQPSQSAAPAGNRPGPAEPSAVTEVPPPAVAGRKPPEATCEGRNPVMYFVCMERECLRKAFQSHPDCQQWRKSARRE